MSRACRRSVFDWPCMTASRAASPVSSFDGFSSALVEVDSSTSEENDVPSISPVSDVERHWPAAESVFSTWTSFDDNRSAFCSIKRLISLNNISSVSGGEESLGISSFSSIGIGGEEEVISSSPGISSIESTRSCVTTESVVVCVLDGVSSSIISSGTVWWSVILSRSDGVGWLSPSVSTRQRDSSHMLQERRTILRRHGSNNQHWSLFTCQIRWLTTVRWNRRFSSDFRHTRCPWRTRYFEHGVSWTLILLGFDAW